MSAAVNIESLTPCTPDGVPYVKDGVADVASVCEDNVAYNREFGPVANIAPLEPDGSVIGFIPPPTQVHSVCRSNKRYIDWWTTKTTTNLP